MRIRFIVLVVAFGFCACDGNESVGDSFNRTGLLTEIADNLIIPSFQQMGLSSANLESSLRDFTNNPTIETLTLAQQDWIVLYTDWQWATAFNFGPAGEEGLKKNLTEEIGTFPVNEVKIEEILQSGVFNLDDFNRDARGIFALEYLLFRVDNNHQAIVEAMMAENRKKFSLELIQNIKSEIQVVYAEWVGSYKPVFIANNGTDAGSSTSELYNEFVKSFEALKNFKVSLPLGLRAGQTQSEPTKVEALYSGKSLLGIQQHWTSMKAIWYGKNRNGDEGVGFYEYLKNVAGGEELIKVTEQQFALVDNSIANLPTAPSFSQQITTNKQSLDALNLELQKQTRYFKSDLSSLLGIAITYASGDGD